MFSTKKKTIIISCQSLTIWSCFVVHFVSKLCFMWIVYVSEVIYLLVGLYCSLNLTEHLQDQYDSIVCSLMAPKLKHLLRISEEATEVSSEHHENQATKKQIKDDNLLVPERKTGLL